MSYCIQIADRALKAYQKLNEPFKSQVKTRIDELQKDGLKAKNIKPLFGNLKGLYRVRSGDYRIVFDIDNQSVTVIAIIHRKDAYK